MSRQHLTSKKFHFRHCQETIGRYLGPLFTVMKPDIHPNYTDTVITCACGVSYRTRSTRDNLQLGICAACHPFFTGEQKFVDTAGRVDKFKRRYGTVRAPRLGKPTLKA